MDNEALDFERIGLLSRRSASALLSSTDCGCHRISDKFGALLAHSFLCSGNAPIFSAEKAYHAQVSVAEITLAVFQPSSCGQLRSPTTKNTSRGRLLYQGHVLLVRDPSLTASLLSMVHRTLVSLSFRWCWCLNLRIPSCVAPTRRHLSEVGPT